MDLRDRVADDLVRALQPQFGAIRQMHEVEGAADDARDFGLALEHRAVRPANVGRPLPQPEDAVGDVVHHRDGSVYGDGQNPVAEAPDHVAVELVGRGRANVPGRSRSWLLPSLGDNRLGPSSCRRTSGGQRGALWQSRNGPEGVLSRRRLEWQYCNCAILISQAHFHVGVTDATGRESALTSARVGPRRYFSSGRWRAKRVPRGGWASPAESLMFSRGWGRAVSAGWLQIWAVITILFGGLPTDS